MNANKTKPARPLAAEVCTVAVEGKPLSPAFGVASHLLQLLPSTLPLKGRVSRYLLNLIRHRENRIVRGRDGMRLLVPSVSEPIAQQIFHSGLYEHQTLQALGRALKPGGIFLDIGANIGSISVPASQMVGPSGKVWSVECSAQVLPYLGTNIELNGGRNIQVVPYALGDRDGATLEFYEAPPHSFGMGSLGPQFSTTPVKVTSRTLDSLATELGISNVAAIKMDVEGAEALALKGASRFFEKNSPLVVYEYIDWTIERMGGKNQESPQALLEAKGYETWILKDYLSGKPPLTSIFRTGSTMLVSAKKR